MVTHNPSLTVYATRVINMLDGQIDTDVKTVSDANLPQPISVKIKKKKKAAKPEFVEISTKKTDEKTDNKTDDKSKKHKKSRRK